MAHKDDVLVFAHIGDLHLTTEDQENFRDFKAIVSEIAHDLADTIDFVYLPGDNADNGLAEQYELARRELARLPMPVHIITGDHDMEPGSLDNFYNALDAESLPKAIDAADIRCLFLDICGPGKGGPDFRIGEEQSAWLANELQKAAATGRRCAIFMHSYPADLRGENEPSTINRAFEAREVLLVDMGHTHYNELANDGRTIFAATRSTGQIEEGPVGYSIATIDKRVVSWRFKELGRSQPVVLITAPADRRLVTDIRDPDHLPKGMCEVRVSIINARPIESCTCRFDDGLAIPMRAVATGRYILSAPLPDGATRIIVEAVNDEGAKGTEAVEIATTSHFKAVCHADGSDADAVGAWEERGIFGTQLGPNRNGKKW